MVELSVTDLLAIYGAIAATASGAWQVYQHYKRGPDLRCRYLANAVTAGNGQVGTKRHVVINVHNRGTEPTTISSIGITTFKSTVHWWLRRPNEHFIVMPGPPGQNVPFVISVGGTFMATMNQTDEFEAMTRNKIVFLEIHHSFSERPKRIRVRSIERKDQEVITK